MWKVLFVTVFVSYVSDVLGNGRMLVPPQRSSLWRDPLFYRNRYVVKNYDDHTLNCGGFWKMHENDGRCGVCGDPWDAEQPRPNEAGGIYARGVIGRTYSTDKRFIDTVIQVTSSMSGFFEFNICPNDNIKERVKQECLDQFPLRILNKDRSTSYGRRYVPDIKAGQAGIVELSLEIPEGLECKQCVLQWRWHGANNYGICRNGNWGKGCGEQPEIYNCADISILPEHVINGGGTVDNRPVKTTSTTTTQKSTTTTGKTTTITTAATTEGLGITTTSQTLTTTTTGVPATTSTTEEPVTSTSQGVASVQQEISSTLPSSTISITEGSKTVSTAIPGSRTTEGQTTTILPSPKTTTTTSNTEGPITTKTTQNPTTTTTTETPVSATTTEESMVVTTESTMPSTQETVVSTIQNIVTKTTATSEAAPSTQEPTTISEASTPDQSTLGTESTLNIQKTTTTGPSDLATTQRVNSKTSATIVSEMTSEIPVVRPETQVSTSTEPSAEPEKKQTTEQTEQSTESVLDKSMTTSHIPTITETMHEFKTTTEKSSGLPSVQTDATKMEVSTRAAVDTTTSMLTQEQTTAAAKIATESSVRISTGDIAITQPETPATEPQTASIEVQNTTPSLSVTINSTSQSINDLNTSSNISDNTETKSTLHNNATSHSIVSDIITSGSSMSSTTTMFDQTTQSVRNDLTTSKSDIMTQESSATSQTKVPTGTSESKQDSSSDLFKEAQTTVSNGAVKNEMMTAVNSDTTITPITITRKPVIDNTSETQINDDSSAAATQLIDSSSVAPSMTSSLDTSSTQSTLSSTHSIQPFVTGSVVTSTGIPKASTSDLSLVDLLNAISKLENVTSDALIDAISPPSKTNNNTMLDNMLNGSAIVTEDNNGIATSSQASDRMTTQSPQSSTRQTTELNTGPTTEFTVNPDTFNVVTSRTTRISQPQGGRFGGGLRVTRISPLDNIVNIDLNIPGGEANLEKERNRLNEGL